MYLQELLDKLSSNHNFVSSRICENCEVFSLRDAKNESVFIDDVLYFSNDLFIMDKSSMPKNILFCGEAPEYLTLLSVNWVQIQESDFKQIIDDANNILLNYSKIQNLRLKIVDSFLRGRGFASVLDEISYSLNTSIVIMDMSGKIISHSKPFNLPDPLWRESVEKGYCPPFFMEHLRDVRQASNSPNEENAPLIRQCIDTKMYYLAKRVYTNGELFGYVFMLQTNGDFDATCQEMVNYIAKTYLEFVIGNPGALDMKNLLYDNLLIDMFKGISAEQISSRIQASQMKFPDRMCLAVIKAKYFRGDSYIRGTLMNSLRQMFPQEHFVYFDKAVVILFGLNEENVRLPENVKEKLKIFCLQEQLMAGISNPYSKVKSTQSYYRQAVKAIELSRTLDAEISVVEYSDMAFYDMVSSDSAQVNVGFYCHPALSILREYDRANNSQLYETLHCYVKNGFNQNLTATELFLHRNSMAYRRQKIVSLTGLNLDDFDTQFNLKYSFMIEQYLEKIRM
jgi:hypothetical protein